MLISAKDREILAFTMGKRNSKIVYNLWMKLKQIDIDFFLTDNWQAFKVVLPPEKHIVGKTFTKAIEGVNTWFRNPHQKTRPKNRLFLKKNLSTTIPLLKQLSIIETIKHHTFKDITDSTILL